MIQKGLEIHILRASWEKELSIFFEHIRQDSESQYFHPHPFTPQEAANRATYEGQDLYYILVEKRHILGYGMLRGWDEEYDIPSIGLCIHADFRRKGLGKLFLHFLQVAARTRGATKVRLKVHTNNKAALTLYQTMGYQFDKSDLEQLTGYLELYQ